MIAGEPFSSEKAFPRTPSKKLSSRETFLFAKMGMFVRRGVVLLTELVCLHIDGRKLRERLGITNPIRFIN